MITTKSDRLTLPTRLEHLSSYSDSNPCDYATYARRDTFQISTTRACWYRLSLEKNIETAY